MFTHPTMLPLCLVMSLISPVHATDLLVQVQGVTPHAGQIGCSLFHQASGFPMDASQAQQRWLKPDAETLTCQFSQLPPGTYAVAVMQDVNMNKKIDTNLVGIPKEAWGVSNNVRPTLRAPKFSEAKIDIAEQASVSITVEVAK